MFMTYWVLIILSCGGARTCSGATVDHIFFKSETACLRALEQVREKHTQAICAEGAKK